MPLRNFSNDHTAVFPQFITHVNISLGAQLHFLPRYKSAYGAAVRRQRVLWSLLGHQGQELRYQFSEMSG